MLVLQLAHGYGCTTGGSVTVLRVVYRLQGTYRGISNNNYCTTEGGRGSILTKPRWNAPKIRTV